MNSIMNKLYYIIIIILSLALNACSTYGTHLKFKPYKEKDYITKTLDIYEIDEILYPVLDTLILRAEGWPEYQGLKTKFAFSFHTGSLYIPGTREPSPNPHVLISVIMPRIYNFARWTQGVFYYKENSLI